MMPANEWLEPAGIIFPPCVLECVACERTVERSVSGEIKAAGVICLLTRDASNSPVVSAKPGDYPRVAFLGPGSKCS